MHTFRIVCTDSRKDGRMAAAEGRVFLINERVLKRERHRECGRVFFALGLQSGPCLTINILRRPKTLLYTLLQSMKKDHEGLCNYRLEIKQKRYAIEYLKQEKSKIKKVLFLVVTMFKSRKVCT